MQTYTFLTQEQERVLLARAANPHAGDVWRREDGVVLTVVEVAHDLVKASLDGQIVRFSRGNFVKCAKASLARCHLLYTEQCPIQPNPRSQP